ncbi:MAG: hypothetical protein H6737_16130 [Alphaproteobacteria bacterium]|nr:hypothetical protein [Alphaproteobacteria bacterium]
MPVFVVVSYQAKVPGSVTNALEAFLEWVGPVPLGLSTDGVDGTQKALERYPALAPWAVLGGITALDPDGLPLADGVITPDLVRDLTRARAYGFDRWDVSALAPGPVTEEALGLGGPADHEPPFAAVPLLALGRSYRPGAFLTVHAVVPDPPKAWEKLHSAAARALCGTLGGHVTAYRRDLWCTADAVDDARARYGRTPSLLEPRERVLPVSAEAPPSAAPTAPTSFDDPLAAARSAIDAGDTATAQAALLHAWQKRPNRAIADVLDEVAAEHLARHGSLGETGKARKDRLDAMSRDLGPADQPAFAAALAEESGTTFARLLPRAPQPDPRWTWRLVRWIAGGRHRSPDAIEAMAAALRSIGDARWQHADIVNPPYVSNRMFDALWELRDLDPGELPLEEGWVDGLDAIRKGVAALGADRRERESRLFAAARARDDDALRVLADEMMEAGDPRGRFLQLQLEQAARGEMPGRLKNELKALQRAWQSAWFDPLPDLVEELELERGIPHTCVTAVRMEALRWVAQLPAREGLRIRTR